MRGIFILLVVALLVVDLYPGEASGEGEYIVFSADIPILWISNTSMVFNVEAIYFSNNKPSDTRPMLEYSISRVGNNSVLEYGGVSINPGVSYPVEVQGLEEGHYSIVLSVSVGNISSGLQKTDFGVSPAPLPYRVDISLSGDFLAFNSQVYNSSGGVDLNTSFSVEVWRWSIYGDKMRVRVWNNITRLSFNVPDSWKSGILVIDIIDVNGWRNGNSIDFSQSIYTGYPLIYDFEPYDKEPLASNNILSAGGRVLLVVGILSILVYFKRRIGG